MLFAVIIGSLVSLITGLIENPPIVGLVDSTYYGYPLVWRVAQLSSQTQFKYFYLIVDAAFWSFTAALVLLLIYFFHAKDRY